MRYLLILAVFISSFAIQAQEATVTYLNKVITDTLKMKTLPLELQHILKKNMAGENYYLFIKDNKSLYTSEEQKQEEIIKEEFDADQFTETKSILQPYSEVIYTDINSANRISKITARGNSYLIEEPLEEIEWIQLKDIKTINGYECKLAEANFKGKIVKAWYTEAINLSFGPSWFGNLPGLILEIELGKRVISATEINFSMLGIMEIPSQGIPTSREKYNSLNEKANKRKEGQSFERNGTEIIPKTVRKY